MPVYIPNKEERDDPKLFATNVRARMATRLGLPTVERDFSDFVRGRTPRHDDRIASRKDSEMPSTSLVDFVGNLTYI